MGSGNEQSEDPVDVHFEVRCGETKEALSEVPPSSDPGETQNGYESEIRR